LRCGHGGDGSIVRRPDSVIENDAVETSEGGYGSSDEGLAVLRREEGLLNGAAEFGATALCDERFGLLRGGAIAEDDLCACFVEEADGGCTNSAGAAGDKGHFAGERH